MRVEQAPTSGLMRTEGMQAHWMHALPKRAGVPAPRINLTFRRIVNPEAPQA